MNFHLTLILCWWLNQSACISVVPKLLFTKTSREQMQCHQNNEKITQLHDVTKQYLYNNCNATYSVHNIKLAVQLYPTALSWRLITVQHPLCTIMHLQAFPVYTVISEAKPIQSVLELTILSVQLFLPLILYNNCMHRERYCTGNCS